jgi:glutamate-1-semialdehyde 2,1-aminomutase
VEELNRKGDALRARLADVLGRSGIDGIVAGFGSIMQVHFAAPPLRNARDAERGDRRRLRLLHLGLLVSGVFGPSRQMYVLSTAMSDDVLAEMAARFEATVGRIAEAARGLAGATA